jgi:plastocyanin
MESTMLKQFCYFTQAILLMFVSIISMSAIASVHTVIMKSISYDPKSIVIKQGDSIEWLNKSYTEHSATEGGSGEPFDTGLVQPKNTSKKIEFTKLGTYSYHCSVHGKTMSGQVVVAPGVASR